MTPIEIAAAELRSWGSGVMSDRESTKIATLAIAALEDAGFRIAGPRETTEMIDAAIYGDNHWGINSIPRLRMAWRHMIAAAPRWSEK